LRPFSVFDEREAACTAGFTVERTHDLRGLADLGEVLAQVVFRGLIREISYE
jgi:hypothetical protein